MTCHVMYENTNKYVGYRQHIFSLNRNTIHEVRVKQAEYTQHIPYYVIDWSKVYNLQGYKFSRITCSRATHGVHTLFLPSIYFGYVVSYVWCSRHLHGDQTRVEFVCSSSRYRKLSKKRLEPLFKVTCGTQPQLNKGRTTGVRT